MSNQKITPTTWIKVVVIGGGTGNSTVLSGLKHIVGDGLSTIVNTFDDGGGTGKLRDEYEGLLAVGDLRQCLEAMSNAPDDARKLFNYRFGEGKNNGEVSLYGQTLGNLIITAAGQINGNNFSEALGVVGRLYDITGRVLPASHDNRRLQITLPDGTVLEGQHATEKADLPSLKGSKVGFDISPTSLSPEAGDAIREADIIVLAPGDLYTSIAPVLAVDGVVEALEGKQIVLVTNLMNRSRHTADFTALDFALEYERILGGSTPETRRISRVLFNTGTLDPTALADQAKVGSHPVAADAEALAAAGFKTLGRDLLSRQMVKPSPNDPIAFIRTAIRHSPENVANAIMHVYFGNNIRKSQNS